MLNANERELILLCARQEMPAALQSRAYDLLGQPLDWDAIAANSWRHGVLSLVFQNLRRLNAQIPDGAMHQLRQGYVRAAVRNRAHFAGIETVLAQLKVDIILLKGAALAQSVYRDPALRPFADIDLLVRERDVVQARDALIAVGYDLAPQLLSERFNRKYHANLPFVRRGDRPVHIELHWKLTDTFSGISFDHEAIFARARNHLMSREDTLVYLAAHLDNHGYLNRVLLDENADDEFQLDVLSGNRLIWFTDLHELLSGRDLDWSLVKERAQQANAGTALRVSLQWLRRLLGTEIPPLDDLPFTPARWPERAIGYYASGLVRHKAGSTQRRWFEQKFLATRKGFELRPVRLLDLWEFLFPRGRTSARGVGRAFAHCASMFTELQARRLLRLVRR